MNQQSQIFIKIRKNRIYGFGFYRLSEQKWEIRCVTSPTLCAVKQIHIARPAPHSYTHTDNTQTHKHTCTCTYSYTRIYTYTNPRIYHTLFITAHVHSFPRTVHTPLTYYSIIVTHTYIRKLICHTHYINKEQQRILFETCISHLYLIDHNKTFIFKWTNFFFFLCFP